MRHSLAIFGVCLILLPGGHRPAVALDASQCWFGAPAGEQALCGEVVVPASEQAGAARLAVVVLKARTKQPAGDPVLFIEGGPGASPFGLGGGDEERMDGWWTATQPIRASRDVILFDPRGVGRSRPAADCPELDALAEAGRALPTAERDRVEATAARACAARLVQAGIPPASLTTPRSAADAFAVARAVGARSINLLAVSYGTRVAFAMLRHPELPVRTAVLDGVYPPDANPSEAEAWLAQRGMKRLLDDCAANRVCRGAFPELEKRFMARLTQLAARPAEIPASIAVTGQRMRLTAGAVLDALLAMMAQAEELPRLPSVVDEVARGQYRAIAPWLRTRWFADPETAEGVALSIECRETVNAADPAEAAAVAKRAAPFDAILGENPGPRLCAAWIPGVSAPGERLAVPSTAPILLLSGAYDSVTPPEWADRAAVTLPNARHVVFRSAGHIVTTARLCAMNMAARFMESADAKTVPVCGEAARPPVFSAVRAR